jgi:hypothetical protein
MVVILVTKPQKSMSEEQIENLVSEEQSEELEAQAEELALALQQEFPSCYREVLTFMAEELLQWRDCLGR